LIVDHADESNEVQGVAGPPVWAVVELGAT
jgi:hypothetical protein